MVRGIVAPCGADRRCEGEGIAGDEVERELATSRTLHRGRAKTIGPRFSGVRKDGRMYGVKEEWPRAHATLRTRNRPPVVGVHERDVGSCEGLGRESPQQAYRLAAKIEHVT